MIFFNCLNVLLRIASFNFTQPGAGILTTKPIICYDLFDTNRIYFLQSLHRGFFNFTILKN